MEFKTLLAALGAVISYLYGGWSVALQTLSIFVIIDYITGFLASGKEGSLSSAQGTKGIAKKVMIFLFVAMGHLVDQYLGGGNHMFHDGTITFFIANESLSIIENAGRLGMPIPKIIQQAVEILKGKSEKEGGEK